MKRSIEMSNFIETLKSVGGVKPCNELHRDGQVIDLKTGVQIVPSATGDDCCPVCHGTGTVLDLAPLLAKPDKLNEVATELLSLVSRYSGQTWRHIHIVGPQRAHSLVYEIARQLGGSAVVIIEEETSICPRCGEDTKSVHTPCHRINERFEYYHLSLPIPDNATVLFVTDRLDEKEMREIIGITDEVVKGSKGFLPYILCLVSGLAELTIEREWIGGVCPDGLQSRFYVPKVFKVVSLHQEKA
jgi:RNA polymerase subunit RPABC4/transcription elongation factor Spt4